MNRNRALYVSIVALFLVAGCDIGEWLDRVFGNGGGDDPPVTRRVDGDGASLFIPADEFDEGIFVERQDSAFDGRAFVPVGPGFVCGPDGMEFTGPVTVQFPIDHDALASTFAQAEDIVVFARREGGAFLPLQPTTVTADGNFVRAETNHFSDFQPAIPVGADPCGVKDIVEELLPELQDEAAALSALADDICELFWDGDVMAGAERVADFRLAVEAGVSGGTISQVAGDELLVYTTPLAQPAAIDVSGTWVGDILIDNDVRRFTFQFLQRSSGAVLGAIPGGTQWRVVTGAWTTGEQSIVVFEMSDQLVRRTFLFVYREIAGGQLRGHARERKEDLFEGTVEEQSSTSTLSFVPEDVAASYEVRRLWAVAPAFEPDARVGPLSGVSSEYECRQAGGEPWGLWLCPSPPVDSVVCCMFKCPTEIEELEQYCPSSAEISVVLDGDGNLVSGGFVSTTEGHGFPKSIPCGSDGCSPGEESEPSNFAVGGDVITWERNGNGLRVQFGTVDPSGALATLNLTPQWYNGAVGGYAGTSEWYNSHTGMGAGVLWAFRVAETTIADVRALLAALDGIATDAEAPVNSVPYADVADHYLHNGDDRAWLAERYDDDKLEYDDRQVYFARIRNITTAAPAREGEPVVLPEVNWYVSAEFTDTRRGIQDGELVTYRREPTVSPYDELRFFELDPNDPTVARFVGNQDGGLTLPWQVLVDGQWVAPELVSSGLRYSFQGMWPHFVHGGDHPEGHPGIDFMYPADGSVGPVEDVRIVPSTNGYLSCRYHDSQGPWDPAHCWCVVDSGVWRIDFGLPAGDGDCAHLSEGDVDVDTSLGSPLPFAADPATGEPSETAFIHLGLSDSMGNSVCLYDALAPELRGLVVDLFSDSWYPEELTDPFLCNPAKTEPNAEHPTVITRWTSTESSPSDANPANPFGVLFVHDTRDENGDGSDDLPVAYEWFDESGAIMSEGTIVIQDVSDAALLHGYPWVEFWPDTPGQQPYRGRYSVIPDGPRGAMLRLDVGSPFAPGTPPTDLSPADARYSEYGATVVQ